MGLGNNAVKVPEDTQRVGDAGALVRQIIEARGRRDHEVAVLGLGGRQGRPFVGSHVDQPQRCRPLGEARKAAGDVFGGCPPPLDRRVPPPAVLLRDVLLDKRDDSLEALALV